MLTAKRPALLILFALCLAWGNTFWGTFQFDDFNVIVNNLAVATLDGWWRSMPGIRPLLKLSYTLNNQLPEAVRLACFHAFNLALHAGNTLLLLNILTRLFDKPIALLATALFAVHPINSEAIALISGRSMSLMALFYLSAILCHLQGRNIGSLLAFSVALAVRETALTLPLALMLIDRQRGMPFWQCRAHCLLAIIALAAFILLPHYRHLAAISLATRSPIDNLITQSFAILYLVKQWFWPFALNADPTLPVFSNWNTFWVGSCLLCLTSITAGIYLWWRQDKFRGAGFALLWFFLHLAPGNSILPRLDIANERHLYLAGIGACLLVAYGLQWIRRHWSTTTCAAALLVALTLLSQQRNRIYFDEITFWQDVTKKSPTNGRAWNNLGYAFAQAGAAPAAWNAYSHAALLQPDDPTAPLNRAALCRDYPTKLPPDLCRQ